MLPKGTIPRGLRIKPPYNRKKEKKELNQIIDENFIEEQQMQNIPYQNPCLGIYICAYPDLNCFRDSAQRKRCYFE